MATNESEFNTQVRKDLRDVVPNIHVWNNTDKFRFGLPDTSLVHEGCYYAIEGKFVFRLPKRATSKCLSHEVTATQQEFIRKVRLAGGYACILVGLKDVAAVMLDIKTNYTLDELLKAPRITRARGRWDVQPLLNIIRGVS